jgi:hypothetical protein
MHLNQAKEELRDQYSQRNDPKVLLQVIRTLIFTPKKIAIVHRKV